MRLHLHRAFKVKLARHARVLGLHLFFGGLDRVGLRDVNHILSPQLARR